MKELLIVFLILILLIMAIAFPFKTRFMIHINLFDTQGYYNIKVIKIKLLTGRFYIDDKEGFSVENSANLMEGKFKSDFAKELSKEFIKTLDVKQVKMFFTGGLKNDAYASAMIVGTACSVVRSFYAYLSEMYEDVKLYEDVDVTFDDNNLEMTLDIVISISLFSIIKSIIKANKNVKVKGESKWKKIIE